MSLGLILIHLLNFFAPAFFLGLVLPLLEHIWHKKWPKPLCFIAQAAIYSGVSALVLLLGFWHFERDGKMATYAALVLVLALLWAWRTRPLAPLQR